jgi:hypothetical protein
LSEAGVKEVGAGIKAGRHKEARRQNRLSQPNQIKTAKTPKQQKQILRAVYKHSLQTINTKTDQPFECENQRTLKTSFEPICSSVAITPTAHRPP